MQETPKTDSPAPSPSKELTDKSLERLRALAKGNGIKPEAIQLIESKEKTYTLTGKILLTPQCNVQSKAVLGRVKTKNAKIFGSIEELQSEVQSLQKEFMQSGTWAQQARQELERIKDHGWGHESAHLSWAGQKVTLAATENCPTCRGTAQHPCPDCRGLGTLHCRYCDGRGQELCVQCAGTGQHPQNPGTQCPTCHGTRFSLCRYCQGTGKMPCPTCQSKGHSPCTACKGTGAASQLVQVDRGAKLEFGLGSTSDLPSGLLRVMSRIGNDKLGLGHAEVTLLPPAEEDDKKPKDSAELLLEAKLPYADLKIKFGSKAALVAVFGKLGKMSGVPPFLDQSLGNARKILADATRGHAMISHATQEGRAIGDALQLVLAGKSHPNELRRLYPVGLSGEAAQEIMGNIALVLRRDTARTRVNVAVLSVLVSAGLFAYLFMTPTFDALTSNLTGIGRLIVLAIIPVAVMACAWAALHSTTSWILKRRYPQARIAAAQNIGRTGYASLALILVSYLVVLFLTGRLSTF